MKTTIICFCILSALAVNLHARTYEQEILNTLKTINGDFADFFESDTNHFGSPKSHTLETDGSFRTYVRHPGAEDEDIHREQYLDTLEFLKGNKPTPQVSKKDFISCAPEEGTDYFRILPEFKGEVTFDQPQTFTSQCFQSNTVSLEQKDDSTVVLTFESSSKASFLCYDWYFIASIEHFHLESIFLPRSHKIEISNIGTEEMEDIKLAGLRIFRFCDGHLGTLVDLFKTVKMFLGGFSSNPKLPPPFGTHLPEWQMKANYEFLQHSMGITMEPRETNYVEMEPYLRSGDMIGLMTLDGLCEMIMLGTGSHVSHNAMILEIDGEVHVVESQAGAYWPKMGLQRTPWKQWVKQAMDADLMAVLLPLSDENSKNFDTKAVYEWFQSVEGLPYGFHNWLFGWIDLPGDKNMPAIMEIHTLTQVFHLLERLSPKFGKKLFGEALNMRLGTEDLTIAQCAIEAEKQGKRIDEVYAMLEIEGWEYSDGYSYVCSSFVTALWKRGGLFGDNEIYATEFTPKDNYQLNFFNGDYKRPQACIDADPDLPYCQIMGKYRVTLPGYNTLKPYAHMNEVCPSQNPDYIRPDGC